MCSLACVARFNVKLVDFEGGNISWIYCWGTFMLGNLFPPQAAQWRKIFISLQTLLGLLHIYCQFPTWVLSIKSGADADVDDNFDTCADANFVADAESRCHHSAVAAALLILAKLNFVRIGAAADSTWPPCQHQHPPPLHRRHPPLHCRHPPLHRRHPPLHPRHPRAQCVSSPENHNVDALGKTWTTERLVLRAWVGLDLGTWI